MEIVKYLAGSVLIGACLYFSYRSYARENAGGGWFLFASIIIAMAVFG